MTILAIETSCDETSLAIIEDGKLIKSILYSQVKDHKQFLGVHPSIAKREHQKRLPELLKEILKKTHYSLIANSQEQKTITAIAVTNGPGLPPALEAGIVFAKKLAIEHNLPLIPVNHLEGHIASIFLKKSNGTPFIKDSDKIDFPILNLIISGDILN